MVMAAQPYFYIPRFYVIGSVNDRIGIEPAE